MLIHFKLAEPFMDFACIVPNVFSEIRIELANWHTIIVKQFSYYSRMRKAQRKCQERQRQLLILIVCSYIRSRKCFTARLRQRVSVEPLVRHASIG